MADTESVDLVKEDKILNNKKNPKHFKLKEVQQNCRGSKNKFMLHF